MLTKGHFSRRVFHHEVHDMRTTGKPSESARSLLAKAMQETRANMETIIGRTTAQIKHQRDATQKFYATAAKKISELLELERKGVICIPNNERHDLLEKLRAYRIQAGQSVPARVLTPLDATVQQTKDLTGRLLESMSRGVRARISKRKQVMADIKRANRGLTTIDLCNLLGVHRRTVEYLRDGLHFDDTIIQRLLDLHAAGTLILPADALEHLRESLTA